ncbi:hypothetical protein X965_10925 [Morganella sp. EGD-HP17]|nr:hypothetical protein X965_10925 [Morganella sp. EGD-HP17]
MGVIMELFNKITGMLSDKVTGATQITAILDWIKDQGGIQGIQTRFRSEGLGGMLESWIGCGANLSVSAEQITAVFGSPAIEKLAAELGITADKASSVIAEYLPEIIDAMSPDGEVRRSDFMTAGINLMKKFF